MSNRWSWLNLRMFFHFGSILQIMCQITILSIFSFRRNANLRLSHLLSSMPIFQSKVWKWKGWWKIGIWQPVSSERQSIDFQNWTEKWRLSNKHTRRARNIWTKVTITCHWFPLKWPALLERHYGLETILFEKKYIIIELVLLGDVCKKE